MFPAKISITMVLAAVAVMSTTPASAKGQVKAPLSPRAAETLGRVCNAFMLDCGPKKANGINGGDGNAVALRRRK